MPKSESSSCDDFEHSESWEDSDDETPKKKPTVVEKRAQGKTPISKVKSKPVPSASPTPSKSTPPSTIKLKGTISPRSSITKTLNIKLVRTDEEGEDKGGIYRSVSGLVRSIMTKNKEDEEVQGEGKKEGGEREGLLGDEIDPFFKTVSGKIHNVMKRRKDSGPLKLKSPRDSEQNHTKLRQTDSDEKEENVFDIWKKEENDKKKESQKDTSKKSKNNNNKKKRMGIRKTKFPTVLMKPPIQKAKNKRPILPVTLLTTPTIILIPIFPTK